jgi:hypothetical protein
MKSHETSNPSKSAIFFGSSAGRFREVSLYFVITIPLKCTERVAMKMYNE